MFMGRKSSGSSGDRSRSNFRNSQQPDYGGSGRNSGQSFSGGEARRNYSHGHQSMNTSERSLGSGMYQSSSRSSRDVSANNSRSSNYYDRESSHIRDGNSHNYDNLRRSQSSSSHRSQQRENTSVSGYYRGSSSSSLSAPFRDAGRDSGTSYGDAYRDSSSYRDQPESRRSSSGVDEYRGSRPSYTNVQGGGSYSYDHPMGRHGMSNTSGMQNKRAHREESFEDQRNKYGSSSEQKHFKSVSSYEQKRFKSDSPYEQNRFKSDSHYDQKRFKSEGPVYGEENYSSKSSHRYGGSSLGGWDSSSDHSMGRNQKNYREMPSVSHQSSQHADRDNIESVARQIMESMLSHQNMQPVGYQNEYSSRQRLPEQRPSVRERVKVQGEMIRGRERPLRQQDRPRKQANQQNKPSPQKRLNVFARLGGLDKGAGTLKTKLGKGHQFQPGKGHQFQKEGRKLSVHERLRIPQTNRQLKGTKSNEGKTSKQKRNNTSKQKQDSNKVSLELMNCIECNRSLKHCGTQHIKCRAHAACSVDSKYSVESCDVCKELATTAECKDGQQAILAAHRLKAWVWGFTRNRAKKNLDDEPYLSQEEKDRISQIIEYATSHSLPANFMVRSTADGDVESELDLNKDSDGMTSADGSRKDVSGNSGDKQFVVHRSSVKHKQKRALFDRKDAALQKYLMLEAKLAVTRKLCSEDNDDELSNDPKNWTNLCPICQVPKIVDDQDHRTSIRECWVLHEFTEPSGCCAKKKFADRSQYTYHLLSLLHVEKEKEFRVKQAMSLKDDHEKLQELKEIVKKGPESDEEIKIVKRRFRNPSIGRQANCYRHFGTTIIPHKVRKLLGLYDDTGPESGYGNMLYQRNIHQHKHYEPSAKHGRFYMAFTPSFLCRVCDMDLGVLKEDVISHCSSEQHYNMLLKRKEFKEELSKKSEEKAGKDAEEPGENAVEEGEDPFGFKVHDDLDSDEECGEEEENVEDEQELDADINEKEGLDNEDEQEIGTEENYEVGEEDAGEMSDLNEIELADDCDKEVKAHDRTAEDVTEHPSENDEINNGNINESYEEPMEEDDQGNSARVDCEEELDYDDFKDESGVPDKLQKAKASRERLLSATRLDTSAAVKEESPKLESDVEMENKEKTEYDQQEMDVIEIKDELLTKEKNIINLEGSKEPNECDEDQEKEVKVEAFENVVEKNKHEDSELTMETEGATVPRRQKRKMIYKF